MNLELLALEWLAESAEKGHWARVVGAVHVRPRAKQVDMEHRPTLCWAYYERIHRGGGSRGNVVLQGFEQEHAVVG